MRTKCQLFVAVPLLLSVFATACGDQTSTAGLSPDAESSTARIPVVVSVVVASRSDSVAIGQSVQLKATALDARGRAITGATFVWASSNTAAVTVSASGLGRGEGIGSAVITATNGGVTGRATIKVIAAVPVPATSGRWVSGYYAGYQRSLYPETQIDFSTMTHIIVGAIQATSTGGVTTDFYIDNTNGPIMATKISSRAHQAGRKAILMLGGDGNSSTLRSAASNSYRAVFVANLLKTMDVLGYDGVDMDWEPFAISDEPIILQLLKDLRAARPAMILTFPIGFVGAYAAPDPWFAQVAPVVDQMNAMTYQMADNWGGWVSWHEGALAGEGSDRPTSIASTINVYLKAGVPAAKLGIGIGAFGSCWQGVSDMRQQLGSSARVVASDNTMSYTNIVNQYYSAAAYRWDDIAKSSYLSFPTGAGPASCNLVSYEDPRAVTERGAYVKSAGLGGAIVWTINEGHLPTGAAGQQDPLLTAAYNAIGR